MRTCVLVTSVTSNSLRLYGLVPASLLCPWDSPGKNTGVGSHFLLQGIFPTQGSNPSILCLLHWQVDSFPLALLGYYSHLDHYPCSPPVISLPAMQETWVQSLDWEDSLEKGKATHSSILAWRIP